MRRAMILASCVVVLAGMSPANGAYNLSGSVGRFLDEGTESYRLRLFLWDSLLSATRDDLTISMESPQGTVYDAIPRYGWVEVNATSVAEADIDELIAGTWTIHEQLGGEQNEYQFELPEITSNPFWTAPPEILSPADGAVVPPSFRVETTDPNVDRLRYISWAPASSLIRSDIQPTGDGGLDVSFSSPRGIQEFRLTSVRVNTQLSLPLSVTRISPTGNATFEPFFELNNFSSAISLTVRPVAVPEPSSVGLVLGLGVALVAARRVRLRSS